MANPTTNYGWPMPTSGDLVTDLPADFDAFGQPVDNTLKALNPETTLGDISYRSAVSNTNTRLGIGTNGQVLSVSAGVPAWTTTADVTPLTTKGDVFTFSTEDARIGVGADGTFLSADSTEATGLKWDTPASNLPSWTTYTPSLSGSITIGNGTLTGRYMESNTTVIAEVTILFGSTTTVNSTVFIGLPFAAQSVNGGNQIHNLHLRDEGTGTFTGHAIVSGSSVICYIDGASSTYVTSVGINSTTPFTWTSTDFIKLNITYEKA